MIIREKIFDLYWYFAYERQQIFYNRLEGISRPWTEDAILNKYKFCNVYRITDRVSQYLVRHVIYDKEYDEKNIIFRILFFKFFNKIETWEYLEKMLGEITLENFSVKRIGTLLDERMANGLAVFNNAYIICAHNAFGFQRKHWNYLALLEKMFFRDDISQKILNAFSFSQIFELLREYPLIGNFVAYQLTTDLNYSPAVNFSECDFTIAGPGSKRGIRKCFVDTEKKSDEYIIRWMQDEQSKAFLERGLDFRGLFGRPLQLIDCQGLFCELDKYTRVFSPDLKSNRVRIKTKFTESVKPYDLFLPPKWEIKII